MILYIAAFIICLLLNAPAFPANYDLPADRRITWQGNVGVTGGIPERSTEIDCTQAPYSVPTDGVTAADTAINACLNGISAEQTAYLPAGTYIVTGIVTVPSSKTLRGAGMTSTIILSNSDLTRIVSIGGDQGAGAAIDVTSGYTKGSSQIVVSDASTISIGDYIGIDELNDATIPVTKSGTGGECTFCSRSSGTRARQQILKVTGKTDNTLDVSPALVWTFSAGNSPQIIKPASMTEAAGVENLTVKNGSGTTNNARNNVLMMNSANSWVKNVKTDVCGYACVRLWNYNYRNEVRDSYFTDCLNHTDSSSCYGVPLQGFTSGTLVENNAFALTSDSVIVSWGASANVIGYNYAYKVHRTTNETTWFWADTWNHGAHPGFNLWEGNELVGINLDSYWGSGSHNTLFRNRILGKEQTITYGVVQNVAAVQVQSLNNYENIVGNILGTTDFHSSYEFKDTTVGTAKPVYATGTSGDEYDASPFTTMLRHQNYNYYTSALVACGDVGEPGCQSGSTETGLPNSFYLESKPSWFGNVTWPPVNPVVPSVADIPSKIFYNTGNWPEPGSTAPIITMFSIPSTATSKTLAVTLTATDETGVTGYCIVEVNNSAGCSWSGSTITSYTTSRAGSRTLYAFAKDAANNVSASSSATVSVTLPTMSGVVRQ